jgi:hypothetical protein
MNIMHSYRQPRILIVSPTYTHPDDQGNSARIFAMGRSFKSAGYKLDLLFYALDWPGSENYQKMLDFWDSIHLVKAQPPARQSFANCWGLDDWCPEELVEIAARLHRDNSYDAVIVNYVWLSKIFEGLKDTLKILDTHDLFGDRHLLAARAGVKPNWYFTTRAEEDRGFDRADVVLAIQQDEQRHIMVRTSAETLLLSHPFPLRERPPNLEGVKVADFGYIGSGNPWNQLSVVRMDEAFAPHRINWLLAGKICSIGMKLCSNPFVLGRLPQVSDFYKIVSCSLNPMIEATGLKIKTIEALAHDSPMIGTVDGFAGLAPEHPFHCCQNAEDVAEAALEFSRSKSVRTDLRKAGRKLFFRYQVDVERQYSALFDKISPARLTSPLA